MKLKVTYVLKLEYDYPDDVDVDLDSLCACIHEHIDEPSYYDRCDGSEVSIPDVSLSYKFEDDDKANECGGCGCLECIYPTVSP